MNKKIQIIHKVIQAVPEVIPYLSNKARYMLYKPSEYKTYDYMLRAIEGLVNGVYSSNIGGQFIDTMANLISGQLTQAYRQAFEDEGFTDAFLPAYLTESLEAMILNQFDFVDQYYRDIVDARVDGTSIAPLLARAQLWANRYNEAYNEAIKLITLNNGGNLVWKLGATEKHCPLCSRYDGIVARASEWEALGIAPQNAPNHALTGEIDGEKGCEGWHCDCRLEPTDARRSPNAYGRLEEILNSK